MPLSAENQAAKDLLERRGVADPDLRLRSILAAERVTARGCQRASHEADGNSLRDISARLKRYNLADELVERIIGRKRPRDGPPDSADPPASKAARVESQAAEKPDAASTSAAPDSDRDQAGAHLPPALAPAASSKGPSLLCPSSLMRAVTCATTAARRMRPAHLQVRVQTTPPLR